MGGGVAADNLSSDLAGIYLFL